MPGRSGLDDLCEFGEWGDELATEGGAEWCLHEDHDQPRQDLPDPGHDAHREYGYAAPYPQEHGN